MLAPKPKIILSACNTLYMYVLYKHELHGKLVIIYFYCVGCFFVCKISLKIFFINQLPCNVQT